MIARAKEPRVGRAAVIAYAANNFGDDLFIDLLLTRYPGTHFDFFTPSFRRLRVAADRPNAGLTDFRTFKSNAKDYDLLLVLGGSMFQEGPNWHRLWLNYARRFLCARRNKVPIAIAGASFGPARTLRFRMAFSLLFRMCASISFRDHISASAALLPLDGVLIAPDMAFVHEAARSTSSSETVGISVMRLGSTEAENQSIRNEYAELISKIVRNGHRVQLLSLQESDLVSDSAEIQEIMRLLTPQVAENVTPINYTPEALEQTTNAITQSSHFIATRFHSAIIAMIANVSCEVIAYHEKIRNTLDLLDFDGRVVDPTEASLLGNPESIGTCQPNIDLSGVRRSAQEHFFKLDTILDSSGSPGETV